MAVATALPRTIAAAAMPAPTMARINAYSAADAPVRPEYSCSPWKIVMIESLNGRKFGNLAQFG